MSVLKAFTVLAVLCLVQGSYGATATSRSLKGARSQASSGADASSQDPNGFAFANAGGGVADGSVTVNAYAAAEVQSEAYDDIVEILYHIYEKYDVQAEGEYCDELKASVAVDVESAASAFVLAFAEAGAVVDVVGEGYGCATTGAAGYTKALGYSEVLLDLFIKIELVDQLLEAGGTSAEAFAFVTMFTEAFASAYADAYAEACAGPNSFAYAEQATYAEAFRRSFNAVVVELLAQIDCYTADPYASATGDLESGGTDEVYTEVESDTVVIGDGYASADGVADAVSDETDPGLGAPYAKGRPSYVRKSLEGFKASKGYL